MSDIFISYAKEDRTYAQRIAEALKVCGWHIWWDRSIPAGRTYDDVIEKAIDAAKCIIVLWSSKSVASRWVRSEAEEGAERQILVPVLIEDVRIPLAFRRIQAAELIDWQGSLSDVGLSSLVNAISDLLGPPPTPPNELIVHSSPATHLDRQESHNRETPARRSFEEMEKEDWVTEAQAAEARGDYASAISIIQPMASKGNAVAQFALGQSYFHGYGVSKDLLEAARWYREAAMQGFAKAQFSLALMYGRYLGMPDDPDEVKARLAEADKWVRKAASQGHEEAKRLLAQLESHGP